MMIIEEDFEKAYNLKKERFRQSGDIRHITGFIMELYDHENTWDYVKRIQQDLYDDGYIHHTINSIDDCMHAEWSKKLSGEYSILFYIIKAYRDTHPNEEVKEWKSAWGDYDGLFSDYNNKIMDVLKKDERV